MKKLRISNIKFKHGILRRPLTVYVKNSNIPETAIYEQIENKIGLIYDEYPISFVCEDISNSTDTLSSTSENVGGDITNTDSYAKNDNRMPKSLFKQKILKRKAKFEEDEEDVWFDPELTAAEKRRIEALTNKVSYAEAYHMVTGKNYEKSIEKYKNNTEKKDKNNIEKNITESRHARGADRNSPDLKHIRDVQTDREVGYIRDRAEAIKSHNEYAKDYKKVTGEEYIPPRLKDRVFALRRECGLMPIDPDTEKADAVRVFNIRYQFHRPLITKLTKPNRKLSIKEIDNELKKAGFENSAERNYALGLVKVALGLLHFDSPNRPRKDDDYEKLNRQISRISSF